MATPIVVEIDVRSWAGNQREQTFLRFNEYYKFEMSDLAMVTINAYKIASFIYEDNFPISDDR